jgi:proliferating cell nuclear antigen
MCESKLPSGESCSCCTDSTRHQDDDACILKASDDADILNLTYESRSRSQLIINVRDLIIIHVDSDRIAEYDMKLMDIDSDTLGIPDTDYDARVTMPASELTRIVRDLSQLGESVRIEVTKDGVRFVSDGEAANGSVLLKQTDGASRRYKDYNKDDDDDVKDEDDEGKKKVKKEDGDVEMDAEKDADEEGEQEFQANSDGEEEIEEVQSKKRKAAPKVIFCVSYFLVGQV